MNIRIILAVMLLGLAAGPVKAADEKWSVSLLSGILMEEKKSGVTVDEGVPFGGEVTRKMSDKLDLSFAFLMQKSKKEADLTPGTILEFNNYFGTLCAAFKLDGLLQGLYLGPQATVVTRSLVNDPDSIGMTSFGYGGRVGYGHQLSEKFSIGLQGNYLKVAKAEKKVKEGAPLVDVTYSVPETSFTSLLLSVKYRF